MIEIGNFGCGFSHSTSSTLYKKPANFKWIYNQERPITFWCDNNILCGLESEVERKFGWLVESRDMISSSIQAVRLNHKRLSESYEKVFTHYREIADLEENFILVPSHGYGVEYQREPRFEDKTKLASIISSNKNWTEGHRHRLDLVSRFKDIADVFGRGIRDIERKEDALLPYFFHFCIENDSYPDYWSEKLLDALVSKCLVFYHGCPPATLSSYFNLDSIIPISQFEESMLSIDFYLSRINAIVDNYQRALRYDTAEDIIFDLIK